MSPQPIEEHEPGLRYPGEDNRSTSSKELLGFYAYSFAAEVFIVCGIGKDCHLYIDESHDTRNRSITPSVF